MRAYRALLRLYPASFRGEYGDEMGAIFARRRRGARGALPVVGLWLAELADVLPNAARVHLDLLRQDLAFTLRTLRRAPGFGLAVVAITALGIGATTSAFSIADHVLFRPLPFKDPDRLVLLWQNQPGYARFELSPANYRDWKSASRSFEELGAFGGQACNLGGDAGEPERVDGQWVTGEVFAVLGVRPLLGRAIAPDDVAPGAAAAIVLGHGLWRARFGADPGVVGRRVLLDGAPYVVVGVMPDSFHFPNRTARLWVAKRFDDDDYADRTNTFVTGVARLKPDVTLAAARAEMRLVAAQLERAYPKDNEKIGASVNRLRDELPDQARTLPLVLVGAAACVLLIACTNLTNLLLVRAMTRRKELAVRATLGAGRERLVRQLLTESLALALAGGTVGILIASAAVPVLARLVPQSLPIAETPPLDLRVLGFALVLTTATGIAFGVLPALRACGSAAASGLREGSRAGVGGRRERTRGMLVAAEVTASVVLLVCCGLLLRALWRVQTVDPGFHADGVLAVRTALPLPRYAPTAARAQFYARVLGEVRALPGVTAAAYTSGLPMVMRGGLWKAGAPAASDGQPPLASLRFVTPGFFAALGVPLRAGRELLDSDTSEAPLVVVVSESFAKTLWPGQNPLGRRFEFAFAERTVVGVAADVRVRGLERPSEPQVYLSHQQVADGAIIGYTPKDLAVRASGDPLALVPAVRAIVHRADPQQPLSDVRLLSDVVAGDTAPRRVQVRVLGSFAAVALFLAAVGLHGLLSFAVSTRAPEIGVRVALGARPADILTMVLRESLQMAAIGVVLGLALAYAAGRAMQALLAGLQPADGTTFAAAVLLAALMTCAGSLLPALRALRVDPLTALRAE